MIRWTQINPDNPPPRNTKYLFLRRSTVYTGFIKDETERDDIGYPIWYDEEDNRYGIVNYYAEINLPDYDYNEMKDKEYFLISWSRRGCINGKYSEWEKYNDAIEGDPIEWLYEMRKEFDQVSIHNRLDWFTSISREQYVMIRSLD